MVKIWVIDYRESRLLMENVSYILYKTIEERQLSDNLTVEIWESRGNELQNKIEPYKKIIYRVFQQITPVKYYKKVNGSYDVYLDFELGPYILRLVFKAKMQKGNIVTIGNELIRGYILREDGKGVYFETFADIIASILYDLRVRYQALNNSSEDIKAVEEFVKVAPLFII